jgi:hypothetical protein
VYSLSWVEESLGTVSSMVLSAEGQLTVVYGVVSVHCRSCITKEQKVDLLHNRKYVIKAGLCSLLLLAVDVWKIQRYSKIQVATGQGMGWLKGICAPCKSDRVLLACSSWIQLLISFLDSWNSIRN